MTPTRLARMSPAAQAWYLAEIAYISERNPDAAAKISRMIRAARQTLADYPKIGPPGRSPGTRRMVVGPYVLTVRLRRGETETIHIRHGRQTDKSKE
ncbi:type II toxin-antitoxin system RelE/ParE family toxin [Paramagnetospirillum marisnigri]|uniref:type II toxin-antitoxin system RelE/ParE family toxin n=1 Tax=Paramagnetospirillum marisnigri TaxID=1285242 RepID=UPI000838B987|nr:type II toxin-antitoxin system RelE/ParE family toxin [Paramagnetospirillum marisnigri]